jgi:hypothetical protein
VNKPDKHRRRRSAPIWTTTAGLLGLAVLAATAACSESSGVDTEATADATGGEVDAAAQLIEMLNESSRLASELDEAESRIIAECLEAQGFTVHDQRELGQNEPYEVESLVDYYPTDEFLPEVDIATEYGFGWWAQTDEMFDSQETQDYYEATWAAEFADEPGFDNSAFESLPDDERRAWNVAYQGEEATAALEGTGEPNGDGAGTTEDGSLEFGDGETPSAPKPGGCQLEMITVLYGEPQQVEIDLDGGYLFWEWRPQPPEVNFDAIDAEYADRMVDAQGGFLSCVAGRGYPGWEFNDSGSLSMIDYSSLLYTGEVYDESWVPDEAAVEEDTSPPVPDLPEDAPDDFEGRRAYEVEMAVAFAECGDESGYRATATATYDAVMAEQYAAIETETYAWQDQIRERTVKAQELIAA